MRIGTVGLALVCCGGLALAGEGGLAVGVHAPPLMAGKWIPDGKVPELNGKVRLVHFWFSG